MGNDHRDDDDLTVQTPIPEHATSPTQEWLVDPGAADSESMVRAEEELHHATQVRPVQRARLVKSVVTEEVTISVPVRREVLRLEYEDISEEENHVRDGDEPFAPAVDQEVVLYAEVVAYEKKIVAKERVRIEKQTAQEVVDLKADLRRERVEVDGDATGMSGSPGAPNLR